MNPMIDPGTTEFASFMTAQILMVMRINLDCNACCRKMRRILLKMKEIETHLIEKQYCRVSVCGRFIPADVAIKIRKKMKRRVEILDIQEYSNME
ncbi:heavy metal-associated isoprenylated plant protein 6-like [Olea europaea var. sylvestris]|uniref:heavy metal-associated isoprenylated plant protein 6-like n=1 Tax=Olea europaea var. sylvestris TaxID=158386 RepID=UPI000C1D10AF|nr:heavy metal-associated isoprenylated plant protein 6-like [Olea europaea var. sylvestris]